MSTDYTDEAPALAANGDTTETTPAPEAEETTRPSWSRRTFLRAAALGAAVTGALLTDRDERGHLHLGGAAAFAHDLSGLQCTANDVRIIGPGVILNEPCNCTGTFNALVSFNIENNAGTERYCLTLHLCP